MRITNRCKVCGHFYQFEASECPECHSPRGSVFCFCGSIVNGQNKYCPYCGIDLRQLSNYPPPPGAKRNPYRPLGIAPDGVDAIDLGLGFRWASCNVGANSPRESGHLYAWGETEERTTCDWSTYSRCGGSQNTCYDLGRDIGGTEFDAARVNWKGRWKIPSRQQIEELQNKCTNERTSLYGVHGVRCIGPNGNSIFLPEGSYWLSEPKHTNCAHFFTIGETGIFFSSFHVLHPRTNLKYIRPVIDNLSFSEIW